MRIVVNDIAASTGGALTVLKEFYNCVRENDRKNEWIFLLGDELLEETENIQIKVLKDIKASGLKKMWFDFVSGKKYIRKLQPDVVVSLQNIITFGLKIPQIVYIHQSIPFQKTKKFSFLKRNERKLAVYQYLIGSIIKRSAKKSYKVIVQTEWMRQAVCESCHIPQQRVVKAAPVVKEITNTVSMDSFERNMFFYPTSNGIYKNNAAVQKASAILTEQGMEHKVIMTLPTEKSQGNIQCVGRIPYEQVLEYYTKGTLVFPSYIESFGYPMAEARQVGTLVLAADTPFAREVLADYENAYFFDPFKPEELASLIGRVIRGDISLLPARNNCVEQSNGWHVMLDEIYQIGN